MLKCKVLANTITHLDPERHFLSINLFENKQDSSKWINKEFQLKTIGIQWESEFSSCMHLDSLFSILHLQMKFLAATE